MNIYVVYGTNEDGTRKWIDSYWKTYENALARLNKLWPYCRKPSVNDVKHHIQIIQTED